MDKDVIISSDTNKYDIVTGVQHRKGKWKEKSMKEKKAAIKKIGSKHILTNAEWSTIIFQSSRRYWQRNLSIALEY